MGQGGWNKGLTRDTDLRVAKNSDAISVAVRRSWASVRSDERRARTANAIEASQSRASIDKRRAKLIGRKNPTSGAKIAAKLTGVPKSLEHRARISAGLKGKPKSDAHRAKILARFKASHTRETSIEKTVRETILALGEPFVAQVAIDRYVVDFLLPEKRLVIECDGDYWHSRSEVRARDERKNTTLADLGYKVLRLPEWSIKAGNAASLIAWME